MVVLVNELSKSDTQALYHVLTTLTGCSRWLDLEYREHLFEIGVIIWTLRVGPRGLAVGWKEGQTLAKTLYAAEQEHLVACRDISGHKDALVDFARRFRAWGVDVLCMIEAEEETV